MENGANKEKKKHCTREGEEPTEGKGKGKRQ